MRWRTVFLDLPAADVGAATAFWRQVTGTRLSPQRGDTGQFATLLPDEGDAYLRVQRVDDGPGGHHLDLHVDVAAEPLDAAAVRARALGATEVRREVGLVLLRSPGGFPFCLVAWDGESLVPGPVDASGGASRADQLCLDVPAPLRDAETGFWSALLGQEHHASPVLPEFSFVGAGGTAVRLLFQRRAVWSPGDRVSAHLDLACADRARLADEHVRLGARVLATHGHWTTMADPTGRPYCLTDRDPLTGRLPPDR